MRSSYYCKNRKARRERELQKLANMRAAKERIRLERIAAGWTQEPQFKQTTCLSFAVRDDLSGVVVWMPLKSVRDVSRRLSVVLREYSPGLP